MLNREVVPADRYQQKLARRFSSVWLIGPPMGDELQELICHLFTPEEARAVLGLPSYLPRKLPYVASKAGLKPEEALPLLEGLAQKRLIYGGASGYSMLPLIPGVFEYFLMNGKETPLHKGFGDKITALFGSGYVKDFLGWVKAPSIRNIPIQEHVENEQTVADADLVEKLLAAHETFAVLNVCQCRQSVAFAGGTCKRAKIEDGCLLFGAFAEGVVPQGTGYHVSREEMRAIIRERWERNLVLLTANVSHESPNAICTCCDCCCHGLETINHFGGMALMAQPRFKVVVDATACTDCGRCLRPCNTKAHAIVKKEHHYDPTRCIGCAACLSSCPEGALSLEPNPLYNPPSDSFTRLFLRIAPKALAFMARASLVRLKGRMNGAGKKETA
ncbi:(Fe-S)-binding protein [Desulfoluna limicola]|uniref:(Fe-S)-binding protein n=1 Tax=Desulfoluna limicola TaxID=2810562 RepID=A0ABM7PID7_9BACT|nr:4Fe-4S dicluster domain-containing protein [Desulfoluna limicola]BCS97322.1 (Fe-S)-binding protein [Desulfoluna limicola]